MDLHVVPGDRLDTAALYALLRLRAEVFVVEQQCPYQDLDGRDLDAGTLHAWLSDGSAGPPVAYLRVLTEPDGAARIGRVCVRRAGRGAGHARTLMAAALELTTGRNRVLDAQSYLAGFYAGFGFTPSGPQFVEDGIPHVPMVRRDGG